jgi:hypothetical protein
MIKMLEGILKLNNAGEWRIKVGLASVGSLSKDYSRNKNRIKKFRAWACNRQEDAKIEGHYTLGFENFESESLEEHAGFLTVPYSLVDSISRGRDSHHEEFTLFIEFAKENFLAYLAKPPYRQLSYKEEMEIKRKVEEALE